MYTAEREEEVVDVYSEREELQKEIRSISVAARMG
jgi:hypothetical protein